MHKSHDYDRVLTRLTTILRRLYEGESLGVSELADEFNVSTKTIQRDFNERLIRFPIEKVGRRWRMMEGHRIEKVTDLENLLTLQILESLAAGVSTPFARRSKALLGRLKNEENLPIRSYLPIEDISDRAETFRNLEEAIRSRTAVALTYRDKERKLHPYRIVNFDGYWYLLAYEPASGLAKKFYLRDIRNLRLLEEDFTPDPKLRQRVQSALNIWFDPNEPPFDVRLLADAAIVKYLKRRPLGATQRIEGERPDGSMEISLSVSTIQELLELLKRWIPDLRVLHPPAAAKAYENLLKKALQKQTGHDAV